MSLVNVVTPSPSCLQQVNGQQGGGSEPAAAAAAAVVAAGDKWKPPQVLPLSVLALRPARPPACPPARPPACLPACLRVPGPRETWLGGGSGRSPGDSAFWAETLPCPLATQPPSWLQPPPLRIHLASSPHVFSDPRQMVAVVRWARTSGSACLSPLVSYRRVDVSFRTCRVALGARNRVSLQIS